MNGLWDKILYCLSAYFLSFGITFYVAMLLFCFQRERRNAFRIRFTCLTAGYLLLVAFSCVPYFQHVFEMHSRIAKAALWADTYMRKSVLLLILAVAIAICAFCFRLSGKETAFISASAYLIQHIPVTVYVSARTLFPDLPRYSFTLIYLAVYLIAYLMFVRRIRFSKIEIRSGLLLFGVMASAVVIFLCEYVISVNAALTANIYNLISCLITLILLFGFFEESKSQKDKEKLDSILRLEQKRYTDMQENMAIINRKSHDLKQLVTLLRQTEDDHERKRVLDSLTREVDLYGISNLTDNKALNALLAEKSFVCEQNEIDLRCIIDGKALDFMDLQDLYTLIGNILDNAIEHVQKIEDPSLRTIFAKVRSENGFLLMHFENSLTGSLKMDGDRIATTKDDSSIHGFGLMSIEYVVRKYQGEMSITAQDGVFRLDIIMPQPA